MPSSSQISEIRTLIEGASQTEETEQPTQELPEEIEIEAPDQEIDQEPIEDMEEGEEGEETPEAAEGDHSVESLKSISDWAAAIEVEPADLYAMEIPIADGQEPVKLGELKDKYQEALRENGKLQQIAEQSTTPQPMMSPEVIQAYGQLTELNRQYQETNWEQLEEQDSGKAALLRQKYQEANQVAQAQIAQAQQKQQMIKAQQVQQAAVKTIELIPEWKDEPTRHEEINKIQSLMLEAGYTPGIVNNMADPIAFKLARELLLLREEKAKATEAVQKLKKVPKSLRTGGKPVVQKANKVKELVSKAKKSRSKRDEIQAVRALIANSGK